jgi:TolB-like protein
MNNDIINSKICLAVLPLQVLSDDPKTEMFCQGIVMDLITDLSRFRTFQIISYETTKGLQPDENPESQKLNGLKLDYIVKGLTRYHNDKILFNLQLINVRQNRLVWAEKFSGLTDEIFQIQDDMVKKIVVSLQQFVDYDLLNEIRKKTITALTVYECWLRGYQELKKATLEADETARTYFKKAMELDPNYARAYMGMSLSYFNEWSCQLWSRWEVSQNGAFEWAVKALELDEWDHVSNAILGIVYVFGGEYEKAEHFLRKSLRINTNDAETLGRIAFGFTYLGYVKEAYELYQRVKSLNPVHNYASIGSFILFEMGDFKEAITLAEKQELNKTWVDFPAYQAAACYLKGDLKAMKEHWQVFLQQFSKKIKNNKPSDSNTALQWMINVNPYRDKTQLKPFWEFMSKTDPEKLVVKKSERHSVHQNQFSLKAKMWVMVYDGKQVQLPELKGYHDLQRLISQPNQHLHCTDLMGAEALEKGEEVFDEKAKAVYQKRILELQEEIKEAETAGYSEHQAELNVEYDALIEHLSQAIGKGGKTRKIAGTIEKCRTAVTWRIRNAIKNINEIHPVLGKHLKSSVKTGVFCEYSPEHEIQWVL